MGKILGQLKIFAVCWFLSIMCLTYLILPMCQTNLPKSLHLYNIDETVTTTREQVQIRSCSTTIENGMVLTYETTKAEKEINRQFFKYLSVALRGTRYPGVNNYTNYMMKYLNLKPLENVTEVLTEFKPVLNDVLSISYNIEYPKCISTSGEQISLFIAIISAPDNRLKRDAIRKTWSLQLSEQLNSFENLKIGKSVILVGLAFIVGLSNNTLSQNALVVESKKNGDILQINNLDTYYSLSVKVTGLLNWLNRYCSKVDFVLKIDDDIYVNTQYLGHLIRSLDPASRSMYGAIGSSVVHRAGKWQIPFEEFPWDSYPIHFRGGAVLLTGVTIQDLLASAQTIPYHPIDDIFLTGFCVERAGIHLVEKNGIFELLEDTSPEPCSLLNAMAWLTISIKQMEEFHSFIENIYRKAIRCISKHTNSYIDPALAVKFLFSNL